MRICLLIMLLSFATQGEVKFKELPKLGSGKYTFLFMDIYKATLWGVKGSELYSAPLRLELEYQRDFDGEDIAKQSVKEMNKAKVDPKIIKKFSGKMYEIFPNVKDGDKIVADYRPGEGVVFYLNSKTKLGVFKDLDFSRHFLNIWLGENTSDPELRDKLLGDKQ